LPDIVLTETRIAGLPLPAKGETNYRDPGVPGLCVRCRPGSKTYIVRYRLGGRASPSVRLTLGAAGPGGIPLGEAKKIAARIAADVAHGRDPLAEQKAAIEAAKIAERRITLGDLLAAHEREQRARGLVSVNEAIRMLRKDCVDVLGPARDPASITRQELVRLMDRVRDGALGHSKPRPGSVSTFKARVHGLFEEALRRGVVSMNPLAGHRAPRRSRAERIEAVKRRTGRALEMNEVAALWRACEDPEVNPTFGLYVRMLLITGARRAELAAARQSWLKAATPSHPPLLVFPAESVKNGTEHVVPLPQLAVNIISRVQRRAFSNLLFPGGTSRSTGKPASISGWSKLIGPLRAAAAARGLVKKWTLHDLRRTARSAWPTLGVDERTCEALLNHTPGDALLIAYDRRDFLAEKTQALELWAAAIENAIAGPGEADYGPRLSTGVIPLAKGAKVSRRANMELVARKGGSGAAS
jgi:integrase